MARGTSSRREFITRSSLLAGGLIALGNAPATFAFAGPRVTAQVGGAGLGDPVSRQGSMVGVNGANIFYQISGQGTPMMLLHGYPLSGALFSRVRDQLGQSFQVITVDHRGYGSSEAPDVPDSIQTYAQDALAVMDQLGINRAVIGGMSMGGPIMFQMFQQAPQRFDGMVLIDTNAMAANPAEAGQEQGLAQMVQQGGLSAIAPVLLPIMLTGATRLSQPAQVDYLTAVMQDASPNAGIGGAIALATRPDFSALLPQVRVPSLVLVGAEDALYPVEISRMMAQAIPGAQLTVIPGAAHAAIFEAPEQSATAILGWASAVGLSGQSGAQRAPVQLPGR